MIRSLKWYRFQLVHLSQRSILTKTPTYGRASIPLLGGILVAVMLVFVAWATQSPNLPDRKQVASPAAEALELADTSSGDSDAPGTAAATAVEASSATVATPASAEVATVSANPEITLSPEAVAADAAGLSQDELAEIGTAAYSDGEFELLQQLIADNPAVLGQLLELYRANTDTDRAKRLAELLGRFDDPAITELGAELVFSGDPDSQKAGLRLLGRQQTRSAQAREVVQQVLEVETNPELLVSAMNAVAIPSSVETAERHQILDQLTTLSEHTDPQVRSHSFMLIENWSSNVNMNDILLRGLSDDHGNVRESATFALLKTRHKSNAVKYALLDRVEDSFETKRIREGALYALQRFKLTDAEKLRYDDARRVINSLR